MAKTLEETTLAEFSEAFLRYQRLPDDWRIRIRDDKTKRMKRDDVKLKVFALRSANVTRLKFTAGVKVEKLLDDAEDALSADFEVRKWTLQLFPGVGTKAAMRSVSVASLLTRVATEERLDAIEEETTDVELQARKDIARAAAGCEEPAESVPLGYLRALVDEYRKPAIRAALRQLRVK